MRLPRFFHGRITAIIAGLAILAGEQRATAQRPLGMDVSIFNGSSQHPPTSINWTNVKSSGIAFAWAKAAEGTATDGWIGEDPDYIYNVTHAASVGVLIGSYYYCHPESDPGAGGAAAEASFFWGVAGPYMTGSGQYLMPMLDFEQDVTGAGYTAGTLSTWCNEWCVDITNYGIARGTIIKPVIYTFISYANGTGGYGPGLDSTVTQWPLDMANVEYTDPQSGGPSGLYPWTTWTFWQYNWQGTVPGITSNVDLDVFNGTSATLQNYVIGGNATFYYWDPQGTTGANPYTGSMSATWESSYWTTNSSGQASPGKWIEGQAAVFGVNTGLGTPAYTVTANSNHTFAGMFDGILNPNSCSVTVNGSGVLTLSPGPQGFYVIEAGDGSVGNLTVNNIIAGTGQIAAENQGGLTTATPQIYLNGANTFTGGVTMGYAAGPTTWNGAINFNNNASFGAGTITLQSVGSGSLLVAEGTSAITIPNPVDVASATTNTLIGNAAGVTYSGNWTLGASLTLLTGGTPGNIDNISGVISGSGGLTVGGAGILKLSGLNTYSGYTTLNGGTIRLGVDSSIPPGSSVQLANGATFDMNGKNVSIATRWAVPWVKPFPPATSSITTAH